MKSKPQENEPKRGGKKNPILDQTHARPRSLPLRHFHPSHRPLPLIRLPKHFSTSIQPATAPVHLPPSSNYFPLLLFRLIPASPKVPSSIQTCHPPRILSPVVSNLDPRPSIRPSPQIPSPALYRHAPPPCASLPKTGSNPLNSPQHHHHHHIAVPTHLSAHRQLSRHQTIPRISETGDTRLARPVAKPPGPQPK